MPNRLRRRVALVAVSASAACGDDLVSHRQPPALTAEPAVLELTAGDSGRIVVSVAGDAPQPPRLLWRSSHPAVVSVDSTGRVRALDAGAAVVNVELAGGAGPFIGVPVTAAAPCVLGVPVTGRGVGAPFSLDVGRTGRPPVVASACRPGGDSTLVYESSDTTIVAIDAPTGLPRGRAEGAATITVRLRAAPSVRVPVPTVVSRSCGGFGPMLTVQPSVLTIAPGEAARLTIVVTTAPGTPEGERPVPTLTTSSPAVATVSPDGTVRAVGPGSAVVTVGITPVGGCGPITQAVSVTVRAP